VNVQLIPVLNFVRNKSYNFDLPLFFDHDALDLFCRNITIFRRKREQFILLSDLEIRNFSCRTHFFFPVAYSYRLFSLEDYRHVLIFLCKSSQSSVQKIFYLTWSQSILCYVNPIQLTFPRPEIYGPIAFNWKSKLDVRIAVSPLSLIYSWNFSGARQNAARKRRKVYSINKSHYCPRCNRGFTLKKNMTRHLRHECGMAPKYQCPYCDKPSKFTQNIYAHIRKYHAGQALCFRRLYWIKCYRRDTLSVSS